MNSLVTYRDFYLEQKKHKQTVQNCEWQKLTGNWQKWHDMTLNVNVNVTASVINVSFFKQKIAKEITNKTPHAIKFDNVCFSKLIPKFYEH